MIRLLLIGISLALPPLSTATHAATINYAPFYTAVYGGDTGSALSVGRELYTRLAFESDGREPFVRMGVMIACAREAADWVVQFHANPDRVSGNGPVSSLWQTLRPVAVSNSDLGQDRRGKFVRDYLRFYIGYQLQRMLDAASAASSASDAGVLATTDHLVLLMGLLDAEALASERAVGQGVAWIVARGQSGRAISQALEHTRPAVASAIGRGRLAQMPADPGARKELLDLVGQLCKAQRIQDALDLCDWARNTARDPAYGSILVLQQAVIAARDQEDPGQAVRLCDSVVAAGGSPATVQLARHLAGMYCLAKRDYPEAVRRAEAILQDPATTRPYRLKAGGLAATALLKQTKPQEAVRVLTPILDELTEPEPTEAAEARQLLCQSLLAMHNYEETIRQCQVLAARHPGHPSAAVAVRAVELLGQKIDITAESAE